ncbi:interleukin-18 receptor accessory protein [Hyperolius riggenbachi]|uniref:interleukin-18 receptor accessory protein n=1 Tax=Hyperolius riggenbachi TaxID=752182 RepID=UPI0035A35712
MSELLDSFSRETSYQYQVFAEENVFFRCPIVSSPNEKVQWFLHKSDGSFEKTSTGKDLQISEYRSLLWFSPAKGRHSGVYMCQVNNVFSKLLIHVQSKEDCVQYGPNLLYFTTDTSWSISCPSLGCKLWTTTSDVTWYKSENFSTVIKPSRPSLSIINNVIQLNYTYIQDAGNYTCDFDVSINSSKWTVRATTEVLVDVPERQQPPEILGPSNGTELKVELGKPFNLTCRLRFWYQRFFNPVIKWIIQYPASDHEVTYSGGQELCPDTKNYNGTECFYTITLNEVTENDLQAKFYCYAQSSIGNVTSLVVLSMKEIDIVFRTYILCASVLLLIIMLLGSGMVYFYRIEIVLLYRNFVTKDETIADGKDFDAFISYASMSAEFNMETFESYSDEYDDVKFATQMLPGVLEKKYNYKLCIRDRDILPGGAYVEDIATFMKRSRRAIVILSEKYITGPHVFELQAAITCSLEEQESLRVILIKLKPFKETECLPSIVKKALKALPMVVWKEDLVSKSSHAMKFWNKIRYYMPVKRLQKNDKL